MFKGSKVSYEVSRMDFDPVTEKYDSTITGRYMEITIKATTEDECYNLIHNLVEYMKKEYINISLADCPSIEQYENYVEYYDIIEVSDHEEYDDLKDIYKEWKKSAKTIKL